MGFCVCIVYSWEMIDFSVNVLLYKNVLTIKEVLQSNIIYLFTVIIYNDHS